MSRTTKKKHYKPVKLIKQCVRQKILSRGPSTHYNKRKKFAIRRQKKT